MFQTEITIKNVTEYLDIITTLSEIYPQNTHYRYPTGHDFLYRGIADNTFKLIPAIYRTVEQNGIINNKYDCYPNELYMLKYFMMEASAFSQIPTNNIIRWCELAQHYGVPTRLLDWTGNPLVALYFACENFINKDATVWLLMQSNYRSFIHRTEPNLKNKDFGKLLNDTIYNKNQLESTDYPLLFIPYYFDSRMSAQSSYFMIWGKHKVALEDMFGNEHYLEYNKAKNPTPDKNNENKFLFRININASNKQKIIRQLDSYGVNAKALFPGLDGIGKYIERKYRFDY